MDSICVRKSRQVHFTLWMLVLFIGTCERMCGLVTQVELGFHTGIKVWMVEKNRPIAEAWENL